MYSGNHDLNSAGRKT